MPLDPNNLPLDDGDAIAALLRRYYPLILEAAYADAVGEVGVELVYDLDNPRIQEYLGRLAREVRRVADTTRAQIRALVGAQAAEGWSIDELADAIRALGGIAAASRAEVIARTETAAAYSLGSLAAYVDSGEVESVEWLTAPDCCTDICQPLDGQRRALGEAFDGGVFYPPAHPNCRCALVPVLRGR